MGFFVGGTAGVQAFQVPACSLCPERWPRTEGGTRGSQHLTSTQPFPVSFLGPAVYVVGSHTSVPALRVEGFTTTLQCVETAHRGRVASPQSGSWCSQFRVRAQAPTPRALVLRSWVFITRPAGLLQPCPRVPCLCGCRAGPGKAWLLPFLPTPCCSLLRLSHEDALGSP